MSPQNDPSQNNDEPRAFDFDAQTAANVAVMKWIDSSDGLRRLVGCTPSMIVGVALQAYRESLAAKPSTWMERIDIGRKGVAPKPPNGPRTGFDFAACAANRAEQAAQRVRDAEAELAAAREAEVAIRAIRRGSLGPDEALKMALELIGRRSDVVAVQLPKPTGVNGQDNHVWSHARHYIEQEFNGDVIVNDRIGINACDLADLGAIFLAAASRADAANVEDAAEDGAQ